MLWILDVSENSRTHARNGCIHSHSFIIWNENEYRDEKIRAKSNHIPVSPNNHISNIYIAMTCTISHQLTSLL